MSATQTKSAPEKANYYLNIRVHVKPEGGLVPLGMIGTKQGPWWRPISWKKKEPANFDRACLCAWNPHYGSDLEVPPGGILNILFRLGECKDQQFAFVAYPDEGAEAVGMMIPAQQAVDMYTFGEMPIRNAVLFRPYAPEGVDLTKTYRELAQQQMLQFAGRI